MDGLSSINIAPLRRKDIYIYTYISSLGTGDNTCWKIILNWTISEPDLCISISFKAMFLVYGGTNSITWLYLRMLQNWKLPERLYPHIIFFGGFNVGGCFLCEPWLVCGDPCRQWWFGAEAQTSDFSFGTLFTQPHSLSGVYFLPNITTLLDQAPTTGGEVVGLMVVAFHVHCIHCSSQATLHILFT